MLIIYLFLLLLLLNGCIIRRTSSRLQIAAGYCAPPLPYRYDSAFSPKANFAAALTPSLLAHYPRRNLLTANAVGVLPQLSELLALENQARQHPSPTAEVAALRQRQLILAQLTLVSATVASVAELDCESERADQVADYLREQDNQRT